MTGLKKNGERTDRDRIFKTLHFLFVYRVILFFFRAHCCFSCALHDFIHPYLFKQAIYKHH